MLSTPSGISRAGQSLQSARTTPLQSASSSRGNVASLIATPHQPPLRMPSDSNWARRTYAVEAKADNTRMMTTPSGKTGPVLLIRRLTVKEEKHLEKLVPINILQ